MPEVEKKYDVFLSYSRRDINRIAPLFDLVRALKPDLVFQDVRNIEFGKEWEPQIYSALDHIKLLIVFWCSHSASSNHVFSEYHTAIANKKGILPVLLDSTAVPNILLKYQAIDLQNLVIHQLNEYEEVDLTVRRGFSIDESEKSNIRAVRDYIHAAELITNQLSELV
jgi:hypothetical protein